MSVLTDSCCVRVYLVTLQAFDMAAGQLRTLYVANVPFITEPTDTPANQIFTPALANSLTFQRQAFQGDSLGGRSMPQWGALDIVNMGELDAWLGYDWAGRPVTVDLMADGQAYSERVRVFTGVAGDINYTQDRLQVPLQDSQQLLDVQAQQEVYPPAPDGAQFDRQLGGQVKPMTIGRAYNVTATLIDTAARRYQVHSGPINEVVDVYDNGQSVGFTASVADGTFALNQAAGGLITATVRGSDIAGAPVPQYPNTIAQIARRLVTVFGPLEEADLDLASFDALDAFVPYRAGFFLNQPANILDVLDTLMESAGAFYGFNRTGLFTVGALVPPEIAGPGGADAGSVTENEILEQSLVRLGGTPARWRMRLDYERNYTVQVELPNLTPERSQFLEKQYRTAVAEDLVVKGQLANPNDPDPLPTLFNYADETTLAAERLLSIYKVRRDVFQLRLNTQGFGFDIGDVIQVQYPRFGMEAGRWVQVIGILEDGETNQTQLAVFG